MGAEHSTTVPRVDHLMQWQPEDKQDVLSLAMGPGDGQAVTLADICIQASNAFMVDNLGVTDYLSKKETIAHLNRSLAHPSSGARSSRQNAVRSPSNRSNTPIAIFGYR